MEAWGSADLGKICHLFASLIDEFLGPRALAVQRNDAPVDRPCSFRVFRFESLCLGQALLDKQSMLLTHFAQLLMESITLQTGNFDDLLQF